MDPLTQVLGLGILFLIIYLLIPDSKVVKFLKQFPGPPAYPFIGNALECWNVEGRKFKVKKPKNQYANIKYGYRFRVKLGYINALFLLDPKDIEKVLTSNVLIEKSWFYQMVVPWLGTGLLISSGKKWFARRKMLTPAFHFRILESFQVVFNEQAQVLVQLLKDGQRKGEYFEVYSRISKCALDIICETAMSKKLNCQLEGKVPYAEATLKQSDLFVKRGQRPWLHPVFTWGLSSFGKEEKKNLEILHSFVDNVIQERKVELKDEKFEPDQSAGSEENVYFSSKKKFAFLDLLIRAQMSGEGLTDDDIREETNTFMFEGHDTTAASMTWTLFLLASNPEEQTKVHAELDSIFGSDRDRHASSSDLAQFKQLECCIKEALRLYPSVPLMSRIAREELVLDGSTVIPEGLEVIICPFMTHRIGELYPEPEKFQPERHLPENCLQRHPYAFIPFSAGPRNCIGQKFALIEEKVILSYILRNFQLSLVDPAENVIPIPEIVLRPRKEIRLCLQPRYNT